MEPGDVGKGIDNDIMQKRGLSKANSMTNQSEYLKPSGPGASASTHNIQFADKPGQTFKAIGPDPSGKMGAGPESYFKKGSTNTAEKPSEDEIDRRMRVALGHSKGPEDYFKSTPKKDDTSGTGTSMTNQPEYLKPSGPKTSVGKAGDRKSTTKDNDEYETDIYGKNSEGKSAGPGTVRNYKGPMTSQDDFDSMSSETGKRPNLRYGYKTGKKSTNEAFLNLLEKKAKKDYDGDGKIESGKDEYLGSRIAAAKKAGKMEEELKGDQDKIDANKNGKIDADDFRKLRSGKKSEKMKAYRADRDKHGEMEEETYPGFSANEIEALNRIAEAIAVAGKDQKVKAKGMGDTVSDANLTDETIAEARGRPKGSTKADVNPNTEQGRDPRQHIQVIAGQAAAGRVIDFKHNNGDVSKISPGMGRKIGAHLAGLKPAEKQIAVNKMHDSAEGLKV
jgi:hypothetical protein